MLETREKDYYNLSIEETLRRLNSNENGISQTEVESRIKKFGLNELVEKERISPLGIFINQFKSILILILIIAALVSGFILQEYTDMIVILIIVVLNSIIGFVQEYRAEKAVGALKKMVSRNSKVLRGGEIREISSSNLVPGDILFIQEGDRIPADGRLIEINRLKIDESPLTGESTSITKKIDAIEGEVS
ncbi:MAG: HAD-IC family P-type ATPase, partial [Candidatus Korarchaeota archaeon]|nr:HAD-IC family P-type ATPase [Candidatus Thorarchaeota archaeon]NIW52323.1 HAD-IC family P-type ATPase [Candidatus Korarchaeota archaeon]